jgi:hypothetical protein
LAGSLCVYGDFGGYGDRLSMKILEVGQKVRVHRSHWARARAVGEIIEILDDGSFVVKFDQPGVGFNGGLCLKLKQEDLEQES